MPCVESMSVQPSWHLHCKWIKVFFLLNELILDLVNVNELLEF